MEEVHNALFQMQPDKAPGVDGFSTIFFQKLWNIVKTDVCEEVLGFLNQGSFDPLMNMTEIILLPKKEANRVTDYRPISLCNVSMKIVTKILANRLSESLPMVISQFQSAFIKGRLISDNTILAHEANHYLKRRKNCKAGFLSIKIDMSKAYDRVE